MNTTYSIRSCWKFSLQQLRWADLKLIVLGGVFNMVQTMRLLKWPLGLLLSVVFVASFAAFGSSFPEMPAWFTLFFAAVVTAYLMLHVLFARPSMQLKNWRYVCSYVWHLPGLFAISLLPQLLNLVIKKISLPLLLELPLLAIVSLMSVMVMTAMLFFLDETPALRTWLRAVENSVIALVYFCPLYVAAWCFGVLFLIPAFTAATVGALVIGIWNEAVGFSLSVVVGGILSAGFSISLLVGIYLRIKHTHYTLFFPPQAKSPQA